MEQEHSIFGRMDVFLTKYGHESNVFFRELAIFWQNMGIRSVIFHEKSEKKGIRFTFGP